MSLIQVINLDARDNSNDLNSISGITMVLQ
jgi:hypothetical protein